MATRANHSRRRAAVHATATDTDTAAAAAAATATYTSVPRGCLKNGRSRNDINTILRHSSADTRTAATASGQPDTTDDSDFDFNPRYTRTAADAADSDARSDYSRSRSSKQQQQQQKQQKPRSARSASAAHQQPQRHLFYPQHQNKRQHLMLLEEQKRLQRENRRRELAAITIQLWWRRVLHKRLKNQAQMVELVDPFDRELRAEKQLFVVQYIYSPRKPENRGARKPQAPERTAAATGDGAASSVSIPRRLNSARSTRSNRSQNGDETRAQQSYISALQTYLSPRFFNSLVARSPAASRPPARYRNGQMHAVGFQDEGRSQHGSGHGHYGNHNNSGYGYPAAGGYASSEQRSMRSNGSRSNPNNQNSAAYAPNNTSETRSQRSHGGQYADQRPVDAEQQMQMRTDPNLNERRSALRRPPAGGDSESRSMRSVGFREAQPQQQQQPQVRGDNRHNNQYAPPYPPSQHSRHSQQQQSSRDRETLAIAQASRQQRPGTARNSTLTAAV